MVPVGEFYCVVEPTDMHSWKFTFERGECHGVARQNIQTDKRPASQVARKPSRPDRKHSVGFDEALDEVEKGWPHREGRALRRGHVSIHNDYAPYGQPGRQIGNQRTRRTMTDKN